MKSVQIRRFFCSVFFRIRTEYGPEKTPYFNIFQTVDNLNTNMLYDKTHTCHELHSDQSNSKYGHFLCSDDNHQNQHSYIFIILNHLKPSLNISSKQWSQAQSQDSSYLKAVSSWRKKQKTIEMFTIMRTVIYRRNHIKIVGTKHNFKDLFLATLLVSLIFANLETLSNSPNVFFYSYIYFSSKHLLNY